MFKTQKLSCKNRETVPRVSSFPGPQYRYYLGHIGLQEELEILCDHPLRDGIDVGQGIRSLFERIEANQTDDLENKKNNFNF